jgi:hypothetical protein
MTDDRFGEGECVRTNFVLIDFENVKPQSLTVLEADHFEVMVFVGANQSKVPFELAAALQRLGGRAKYIKIAGNGPNALDFHIAFYVGQLAAKHPTAYFHVISKDTGFDPLMQHLKSRKILCGRLPKIDDIPLIRAGNNKSPEERAQMLISKLQQPKATRPRTAKTLSSTIAAFFQQQLSDEDIAAVIAAMQGLGFLKFVDGKVSYTPSS